MTRPGGGKGDRKGEEISAECRALQGAITARPARGGSFHVSALTRTTESTRGTEELEAQATPLCGACKGGGEGTCRRKKDSPEEVEAYHTRTEGPNFRREIRGIASVTLSRASFISNPDGLLTKEETGADPLPSLARSTLGGAKLSGEGRQDAGKTKAGRGLAKFFL